MLVGPTTCQHEVSIIQSFNCNRKYYIALISIRLQLKLLCETLVLKRLRLSLSKTFISCLVPIYSHRSFILSTFTTNKICTVQKFFQTQKFNFKMPPRRAEVLVQVVFMGVDSFPRGFTFNSQCRTLDGLLLLKKLNWWSNRPKTNQKESGVGLCLKNATKIVKLLLYEDWQFNLLKCGLLWGLCILVCLPSNGARFEPRVQQLENEICPYFTNIIRKSLVQVSSRKMG